MSRPDARLAEVWAADEPPAADVQFVAAVMARAARRRLVWELGGLAPVAIAAAAILWAAAPWLSLFATRLAGGTPAISAALAALILAAWLWTCVQGRHRSLALLGIEDAA